MRQIYALVPKLFAAAMAACLLVLIGCQSEHASSPLVTVEPLGVIGDTTGADTSRQQMLGSVQDLAVGREGNLYVLDDGWQEIRTYGAEGELRNRMALQIGEGPGEVRQPSLLAVGPENRFYMTGMRSRRITILDREGQAAGQFPLKVAPTNLLAAADGIYVTGFWLNTSGGVVRRYSREGSEEEAFLEKPENWREIARTGNFERIARNEDGGLLYSFTWPYRILKLDRDRNVLAEASGQPSFEGDPETVRQDGFEAAVTDQRSSGLAVLSSGYVLNVVRDDARETWYMDVFSPELRFIKRLEARAFDLGSYRNFAAGGEGNVYLSSPDPRPHVRTYRLAIE